MDARLVKAATDGDVDVLRQRPFTDSTDLLLQSTPLGNTALHIAVRFGRLAFAEELYRRCYSLVSKRNLKGDTPLHIASRAGYKSIVESFVMKIMSVTTPLRDVERGELHARDILRIGNEENNTALHEAVRNGHVNVVVVLTAADPELWCLANNAGESPLYLATQEGLEALVTLILRTNVSSPIAHSGRDGQTALHAAVVRAHYGIIKLIVQEKQELLKEQDGYGKTALHYAASMGDLLMVRLLVQSDTSIAYLLDVNGQSPLHEAAINGHFNIIDLLLEHCPDIMDLPDVKGQNVLHVAVKNKQFEVVQYLLNRDDMEGFVNQRDVDGNTPLHVATINCFVRIIMFLSWDARVDVKAMNGKGLTALDIIELDIEQRRTIFQKFLASKVLKIANDTRGITTRKIKLHLTSEAKSSRESYKETVNTLSVVATLIATIAFAAALTMPGGYQSDGPNQGTAILIKKAAFKAFVIFDAVAICNSIMAVFLLVWATIANREAFVGSVVFAAYLTWGALVAIGLAFATGFYAVLSNLPWLAIYVCYIVCGLPVTLALLPKMVKKFS